MTGQGRSHGWAWDGIGPPSSEQGPPTGELGPATQNVFFPTRGFYYRQKYSSVSSAVRVAGLRWSRRWSRQMWRSWADVVTCGQRLWGRLDILPNSLKWHWRWLMVEKWTFNYLATGLVQSACQLHTPSKPIVPSTGCTRVMIMLFNQFLDLPNLSGGWIILAKEKCSLTRM